MNINYNCGCGAGISFDDIRPTDEKEMEFVMTRVDRWLLRHNVCTDESRAKVKAEARLTEAIAREQDAKSGGVREDHGRGTQGEGGASQGR